MRAGQVDGDIERADGRAQHVEARLQSVAADVVRANIRAGGQAVRQDRPTHLADDTAHVLVVMAQHRQSVERQVVQELDEALLEQLEIAAVGAQVIVVDVGDDRDERLQMRERCIALVRLGNQIAAGAETGVAAGALEAPADDEGRILAPLGEDAGDQAGGGRLAMGAGHGDGVTETHQLAEHFRARHDRNSLLECGIDFGIAARDRARDDEHVGAGDVGG